MAQTNTGHAGMRAMFWSWMTIVIVGLAVMIILPLGGR